MWRDYSLSYIRNNRASGLSIMIAALISALLLSILCSLFYNLWAYEVERIRREEGDWQGRITADSGEVSEETLNLITGHGNVERAVINRELSSDSETVVDIYLVHRRSILTDMPQIAALAGFPPEAIAYHHSLLSLYLIRDPADPAPRLLFPFFLSVTGTACLSLILIIHNSFAVSMNARIHQFGIFSSVGATPRQIRACLLQEAAMLCLPPVILGNLLGILISMGILEGINLLLSDVAGRLSLPFTYHPLILLFSLLAAALTIWLSAWIPARKLSRLSPLAAIRSTGELALTGKRSARILSGALAGALTPVFGVEGELAGNALKAQRKALRTAAFSLTFSFLAFSLMMCFFSLTRISQQMTYFERYQDAWDLMVTMADTSMADASIETGGGIDSLKELPGIRSAVLYRKARAQRLLTEDELSEELLSLGGLRNASSEYVSALDGGWLVNAPLIIMDDASFLTYCDKIGAEPALNGAVILNQTRDATDPNFRTRASLPYIKGNSVATTLQSVEGEEPPVTVPVLAYTEELPALREEYGTPDLYELVHFMPESLWREVRGSLGEAEPETFIRILAREGVTLSELTELEASVSRLLPPEWDAEVENRLQEVLDNDSMFDGMMLILGGFCILLAIIGIGNVFSNTLGFVRERKREFARYLSVGLTPGGIRKIFFLEALVIAGRPVLVTLPLLLVLVGGMLKLSYLEPGIFLREAPVFPILAFLLSIFGFVALAYYLGGRKVQRSSLAQALRDDTLL